MILKKCFTDEFITSRAGNNIHKKIIYEKVVHAFYLLEKIAKLDYKFVFKGGTSLMLLLGSFNRFSEDIDILIENKYEEKICKDVYSFKDDIFYKVEEDVRDSVDIIKRHFRFYYKSIYKLESQIDDPNILLDIVFNNMEYKKISKHKINSSFVETDDPYLSVEIPSIDEMLGDKLTAFAPKTIGILYNNPRLKRPKRVEIIKQLYDIAKLFDNMSDISVVKDTYIEIANIQINNRHLQISFKDSLKDTIEACKLIITQNRKGLDDENYQNLKKGYEGFKNFTVNEFTFQDLIINAVKCYILCISLLYQEKFEDQEKPINCFVGRDNKIIRQYIGIELYEKLMQACKIENKNEEH